MDCAQAQDIIEKNVCVQAAVRVVPEAELGEVSLACVGEPVRERCGCGTTAQCDFVISQMVRLRIPIRFGAEAKVCDVGIACESAPPCEPDPCKDPCDEYQEYLRYRDNRWDSGDTGRSFERNYRLTQENCLKIT